MMSGSSSSATVRVEKATSDLLMTPDWAMNMDICDYISSYPGQARDVLKAVKKRLQHKSSKVQFLALTLLETMVQNCSDFVHFQIVERNILDDMVKIVKKKTDMNVRHKTLELLDTWQEAFGGRGGKYPQYYYACDELRRSGVQFPQRSSGAAPPIFTPPVVHPVRTQAQGYGMPSNSSRRLDEAMASENESLSMSTLESMENVNELLNEMLQAMSPSDASSAIKDEIVVDITARCRSNQRKLIQMLTTTEDEELLGRGLELHEAMQSLLLRHDAIASGSLIPAVQTSFSPRIPELRNSSPRESEKQDKSPRSSVISPTPSAATAISGKSLINQEEEEDDDDFAQLARRHSKSQSEFAESSSSSSASTSKALVLADPPPAPAKISRDQDMIDFLSLALTTTTPYAEEDTRPNPPITGPTGINIGQPDPYASQVNPVNNNSPQVPMQSYVVPWAQPPQPQPFQPPQPQFPQQRQFMQPPQHQQPRQQQQQPPQQPRHQYPAHNYGYPPPPWASSASNSNYQNLNGPSFSSRTETLYGPPTVGSVPWRASNGPSSPVNGGQKPYIPPYRLFDDLNVLGSRDGAANGSGNTTASSTTTTLSGQSRIGGWR